MLPRSAVVRSSFIHRFVACVVIASHLGTPALALAAETSAPKETAAKPPATASGTGVTTNPISTPWTIPPPEPEAKIEPVKPGVRPERIPKPEAADPMRVEYDTNTHAAISQVAIRRPDCVADNYLKTRLLLSSGINNPSVEGTPADRFRQAAIDEDGSANFFRHFYDPVHNNVGLTDGGGWFSNSMQWAWDGHDQDWRVARQAFFEAVTQAPKSARDFHLARAFYALGHVAHLVEDLAQPQHVRNDAHLVHPYESYCRDHYGDTSAVAGLGNQPPPTFSVMSNRFEGIPPEFAAFWDTEQYTGQTGITSFAGTLGLAEFTNLHFITDDTMFGPLRTVVLPRTSAPPIQIDLVSSIEDRSTAPHHQFNYPTLRNTDLADWFPASKTRVTLQREGEQLGGAVRYVGYSFLGVTNPALFLINNSSVPFIYDHEIGFDDVTYQAAAQILIPKANAYVTGLVNLFFRGKIGLNNPTTTWDAGLQMNSLVIRNESGPGHDFGPGGTWSLYYDDANGNRQPVPGFDASAYPSGGLANGATFTAKFPEMLCEGGYGFTLVFRGRIGNEVDAVAARTFYTAIERWVGTYNVPSGDPLCTAVSGPAIMRIYRPTPPGYDIVGWIQWVGASNEFQVTGTCEGTDFDFGIHPEVCGTYISGTISGASLINVTTDCWYCPLNPPPTGPFFSGTITGMQRQQ